MEVREISCCRDKRRCKEFETNFEDGRKTVMEANRWGTKQGAYTFRKKLRESTFGSVLLGKRGKLGALVAVTLLQVPSKTSTSPRMEMLQELRRVSHENVVNLIDCYICYEHDDVRGSARQKQHQIPIAIGLAMQHCISGDLFGYLHKYRVSEATRLRWYKELTNGLHFLHSIGAYHWDLNPGNVWIEDDSLKIAYGGIAHFMWYNYSTESFGDFMSTFKMSSYFIPPEAWSRNYSEKSDVFSLGLLFLTIAESPEDGFFQAKWGDKTDSLGHLIHENIPARHILPTHMLLPSISNARPQELRMFNKMLHYNSQDRPDTDSLLSEHLNMMKPGEPYYYEWTKWCAC